MNLGESLSIRRLETHEELFLLPLQLKKFPLSLSFWLILFIFQHMNGHFKRSQQCPLTFNLPAIGCL